MMPGEWHSVLPQDYFFAENQKKTYHDIYTCILIEEEKNKNFLPMSKQDRQRWKIFISSLFLNLRKRFMPLFLQYIEQTTARAGNRKDYQGVCAIIRNLRKAGGQEQASEIKQKLFNKYANRPAFRDELSRV